MDRTPGGPRSQGSGRRPSIEFVEIDNLESQSGSYHRGSGSAFSQERRSSFPSRGNERPGSQYNVSLFKRRTGGSFSSSFGESMNFSSMPSEGSQEEDHYRRSSEGDVLSLRSSSFRTFSFSGSLHIPQSPPTLPPSPLIGTSRTPSPNQDSYQPIDDFPDEEEFVEVEEPPSAPQFAVPAPPVNFQIMGALRRTSNVVKETLPPPPPPPPPRNAVFDAPAEGPCEEGEGGQDSLGPGSSSSGSPSKTLTSTGRIPEKSPTKLPRRSSGPFSLPLVPEAPSVYPAYNSIDHLTQRPGSPVNGEGIPGDVYSATSPVSGSAPRVPSHSPKAEEDESFSKKKRVSFVQVSLKQEGALPVSSAGTSQGNSESVASVNTASVPSPTGSLFHSSASHKRAQLPAVIVTMVEPLKASSPKGASGSGTSNPPEQEEARSEEYGSKDLVVKSILAGSSYSTDAASESPSSSQRSFRDRITTGRVIKKKSARPRRSPAAAAVPSSSRRRPLARIPKVTGPVSFLGACFAMLVVQKLMRVVKRRRQEEERVKSMPRAAFIIQCAVRRKHQNIRLREKRAGVFIACWLHFRFLQFQKAKEKSILLLQRVFRGAKDRSFCYFMHFNMRRNAALGVLRRRVHRWEAKVMRDRLRLNRECRNCLIQECKVESQRIIREERMKWLAMVKSAFEILGITPLMSTEQWSYEVVASSGYHPILCSSKVTYHHYRPSLSVRCSPISIFPTVTMEEGKGLPALPSGLGFSYSASSDLPEAVQSCPSTSSAALTGAMAEISFQRLWQKSVQKKKGISKGIPVLQKLYSAPISLEALLDTLFNQESSEYLNTLFPQHENSVWVEEVKEHQDIYPTRAGSPVVPLSTPLSKAPPDSIQYEAHGRSSSAQSVSQHGGSNEIFLSCFHVSKKPFSGAYWLASLSASPMPGFPLIVAGPHTSACEKRTEDTETKLCNKEPVVVKSLDTEVSKESDVASREKEGGGNLPHSTLSRLRDPSKGSDPVPRPPTLQSTSPIGEETPVETTPTHFVEGRQLSEPEHGTASSPMKQEPDHLECELLPDNELAAPRNPMGYSSSGLQSQVNVGGEHPIHDQGVLCAFVDLLERTESIERKQLQHVLWTAHSSLAFPMAEIHFTMRLAAQVPPLFSILLFDFRDKILMQQAARLFCEEKKSRFRIVVEYESLPLQHLSRPDINPTAESRMRNLADLTMSAPDPLQMAHLLELQEAQRVFRIAQSVPDGQAGEDAWGTGAGKEGVVMSEEHHVGLDEGGEQNGIEYSDDLPHNFLFVETRALNYEMPEERKRIRVVMTPILVRERDSSNESPFFERAVPSSELPNSSSPYSSILLSHSPDLEAMPSLPGISKLTGSTASVSANMDGMRAAGSRVTPFPLERRGVVRTFRFSQERAMEAARATLQDSSPPLPKLLSHSPRSSLIHPQSATSGLFRQESFCPRSGGVTIASRKEGTAVDGFKSPGLATQASLSYVDRIRSSVIDYRDARTPSAVDGVSPLLVHDVAFMPEQAVLLVGSAVSGEDRASVSTGDGKLSPLSPPTTSAREDTEEKSFITEAAKASKTKLPSIRLEVAHKNFMSDDGPQWGPEDMEHPLPSEANVSSLAEKRIDGTSLPAAAR